MKKHLLVNYRHLQFHLLLMQLLSVTTSNFNGNNIVETIENSTQSWNKLAVDEMCIVMHQHEMMSTTTFRHMFISCRIYLTLTVCHQFFMNSESPKLISSSSVHWMRSEK
ncbi:CLUMA_CG019329, isoform A [Clunio marinus]|uniref:CLUMA_CG019329, isoform A n=1 Tax=Clunio marinus TaxID=568069 RepID=A0A1J1J0N2_9DIPT|nr:CLUMA_CG019329, isoform A [Clunio marinus]